MKSVHSWKRLDLGPSGRNAIFSYPKDLSAATVFETVAGSASASQAGVLLVGESEREMSSNPVSGQLASCEKIHLQPSTGG
jgi:hypothetical protein